MSRSYHVTKRSSVRAFVLDGDTALIGEASDKAGIKKREQVQRARLQAAQKRQPNRTIVAAERRLTGRILERNRES